MKQAGRIKDWRKVEPHTFFGEKFTPSYLSERRQDLEMIVAGFLTSAKTPHVIEFQGKRRCLVCDPRRMDWAARPGCEAMAQPVFAVIALQYLYRLERAHAADDIDQAIILAVAFARADTEVQNLWYRNMHSYSAFASVQQSKETRQRTRLGKSKLKDIKNLTLETIVANHRRSKKRRWLNNAVEEINTKCGVHATDKTLKREMQKRGIWEKSTSVRVTARK